MFPLHTTNYYPYCAPTSPCADIHINMVRQKSRWLLVQFEFESDIISACSDGHTSAHKSKKRKLQQQQSNSSISASSITQLNATDIYRSLQDTLTQNFGLVGACTTDIQVRLYDPKLQVAIIKTSREKCSQVRSAITLTTQIKQGGDILKVVASTLSVSGSARTCRNTVTNIIQKRFYTEQNMKGEQITMKYKTMEKSLKELESRLEKIDSSC